MVYKITKKVFYKGVLYEEGKEYELADEDAKALGTYVKPVGEAPKPKKSKDEPKENDDGTPTEAPEADEAEEEPKKRGRAKRK